MSSSDDRCQKSNVSNTSRIAYLSYDHWNIDSCINATGYVKSRQYGRVWEKFFLFFFLHSFEWPSFVGAESMRSFFSDEVVCETVTETVVFYHFCVRTYSMEFTGYSIFFRIGSSISSRLNFICCTRK